MAYVKSAVAVLVWSTSLVVVSLGREIPSYRDGDHLQRWDSSWGQYSTASVATDAVICSQIGTDVMRILGGSAVDAAIAAMLCVGVVNCQSTGIGGGHFMTIYDYPSGGDTKEMNTIIARETAPAAAHRDMYVNNTGASAKGGLAIGVPGEVAGFHRAHELYGLLDWAVLFEPTIILCDEGFEIGPALANSISSNEGHIREDENLSELFVDEEGNLMQEGDLLVNTKLARTLEQIAEDPRAFYEGQLAQDIADDVLEYDGIITADDLHGYDAKIKPPMAVHLANGGYSIYSPRPPSSGAVYEFMFNVLNGYLFDETSIEEDSVVQTYHRILEAFKFAYARRSELGDEDFLDVEELLGNMTSPDYGEWIRSQINETHTQDVDYYGPSYDIGNTTSTTHLSVFGPDGTAVALTSTINFGFGSKTRGSRTGIIFNNEMDDFSTPGTVLPPPSESNYIEPGKMPMSSMCPALVFDGDGDVVFSSGGAGGTTITTTTAWVAMHTLWLGMKVHEATDHHRVHHQLVPNSFSYETGLHQDIVSGLRDKGHVALPTSSLAVIQSIQDQCKTAGESDTCILAVSDGRRPGSGPDGY